MMMGAVNIIEMVKSLSTSTVTRKLTNNMMPGTGFIDFFDFICTLCGRRHKSRYALCEDCVHDLPTILTACLVCGRSLPHAGICGGCLNNNSPIDRTVAAFHYTYPVDLLIKNIKYKQQLSLVPPLATVLAKKLTGTGSSLPDVLLPVPLYMSRLYKRGFNQSAEICKFLCKILNLQAAPVMVSRVRSTLPMAQLGPKQRYNNVRDAFKIVRPVNYKSIAVIDDVLTSGATALEIASLLKSEGVERVELWSLARA